MTKSLKVAIAIATATLSAHAAFAATPDAKLWAGTWHLNVAKSRFGAVGKEQSETRTYDYAEGKLTMKSTSKDGAGKGMTFSYSAGCDSNSAPMIGNPNADSISLTCGNAREIKATSRMKGKVTVQSTATVSADGKHLTIKRTYVAMKGKPSEVLEFDR